MPDPKSAEWIAGVEAFAGLLADEAANLKDNDEYYAAATLKKAALACRAALLPEPPTLLEAAEALLEHFVPPHDRVTIHGLMVCDIEALRAAVTREREKGRSK